MIKKTAVTLLIVTFIATFIFHLKLNFDDIVKPPSETWGKEVLISTGDLNTSPKIMRYKENYVVAHSDGDSFKIIIVDDLGRVLKQKKIDADKINSKTVGISTDEKNIIVSWISSRTKKDKLVKIVKLDDSLNIISDDEVSNVMGKTEIGSNLLIINYEDNFEIRDLKLNKTMKIEEKNLKYTLGIKDKDKYVICYANMGYEYKYFYITNGEASESKVIGKMSEMRRLNFIDSEFISDGKYGYILNEYNYMGDYGGIKVTRFALGSENQGELNEVLLENGSRASFLDVTPYYEEGKAKILVSTDTYIGRKRTFSNIAEYTMIKNVAADQVPASRTRTLSMRSNASEDTIVFCDFTSDQKSKVYITSKNEAFKNANNNARSDEYKLALIDTCTELVYSAAYILVYGSLWIIPSLCVASLACLFEYKLKERFRKLLFVIVYIVTSGIKTFFVHGVSFTTLRYFIPDFITPIFSTSVLVIISLLCCIYGFKNYSKNVDQNVIAKSISPALLIDAYLTLLFVIPFIK